VQGALRSQNDSGNKQAAGWGQLTESPRPVKAELLSRVLIEQAEQPWIRRSWSVPALLPVVDHGGADAEFPLAQPLGEGNKLTNDIFQRPAAPEPLGKKSLVGLPPGRWGSHRPFLAFVRVARIGALYDPAATPTRVEVPVMTE
jgi:hypothetical protein